MGGPHAHLAKKGAVTLDEITKKNMGNLNNDATTFKNNQVKFHE